MAEKHVRGDKFWRSAALLALCGLVYYFSYDHGRQTILPRLEKIEKQAREELEVQRREILRLQAALSECGREVTETPALDRIPLRLNQSKMLFDGRLVVTLLKVDSAENSARIQLNFIERESLVVDDLMAGGSLRFTMDNQNWAIVISALSLSTANLNLVKLTELKIDDQ